MAVSPPVARLLEQEAHALAARLDRIKSFALLEPMVPAANLFPNAQSAIEATLIEGRRELRRLIERYLSWLRSAKATTSGAVAQRRFAVLRLKFHAVLNEFDMFSDVITQRSEHENGTWLSGLDVVAADALRLSGGYYALPPVICYLARGPGAAIRRARTRLPGGRINPVAIIRVPRERMVGSGIASSLIHEVGHQAAALLDLVPSLRLVLQARQQDDPANRESWAIWERWISEIVADFWSVARVGITATAGLIGVVSLPRHFVFRVDLSDPHPTPWLRVKLSAAMGAALHPDPQWAELGRLWDELYPRTGLDADRAALLDRLEAHMPAFVALLVSHRPNSLGGQTLGDVLEVRKRSPERLASAWRNWLGEPAQMYRTRPADAFAVLGQARYRGHLGPRDEAALVSKLLTYWALRTTLDTAYECAVLGTVNADRRVMPASAKKTAGALNQLHH